MSARNANSQRNPQGKEKWMTDMEEFHARVHSMCRSLGRFTRADFLRYFGFVEPMNHGYKSLEDLFVMRRCEHEGWGVFIYTGITRPVHPRGRSEAFGPPKIPPNVPLELFIHYHNHVDSVMRQLKRFSISEFEKNARQTHEYFGYYSVEHVLCFRGCQRAGEEFVYDEAVAFQMKVLAVASYLNMKFTELEFKNVYRRFFITKKLQFVKRGFDSMHSLFESLGEVEIVRIGSEKKYIIRKVNRVSVGAQGPSQMRNMRDNRRDVQERVDTDFNEQRNNVDDVSNRPQEQSEKDSRKKFLSEQRMFHKTVDVELSTLVRFTEEEFLDRMEHPNLEDFGYGSATALFLQRGCGIDGIYFTFDRISAHRSKSVRTMEELRNFTEKSFRSAFWKMDNGACDHHRGHKTFHLFMKSFPEIQCVQRRGETDKYIYHGSNGVVGDEEEQNEKQFEEILKVARTLKNPFTEKELQNAYGNGRPVPLFLETIPGIEYSENGFYRHIGRTVSRVLNQGSEKPSEIQKQKTPLPSEVVEIDSSDSEIEILHENIVTKKRTLVADEEKATSDGDEEPVVKKHKHAEEASPKPTDAIVEKDSNGVSNDVLCPDEEMRLKTKQKQANITSNTSPALLHNSDEIRSENVPVAGQIEKEANSEGKDGQEVTANPNSEERQQHQNSSRDNTNSALEKQVSAITAGLDQSIQKEGAMGGTGDHEAVCSHSQPSEASSADSDDEALIERMNRYHSELLNAVISGAMKKGVDPEDLGKKVLDQIFKKNPKP